jgi:Methyltransferase FkbM domain
MMVDGSLKRLDNVISVEETQAKRANDWLLQYRKNVTSQMGEDGIIEKIFELIPDTNHWCVEFGAGDGVLLSNTYNLIANKGWASVQIESNVDRYTSLVNTHSDNSNVICIHDSVSFEGAATLDNLLSKTPIPTDFDLLSIDIDGNDYHVWEAVHTVQPKVVVIEFNPTIPHQVEFIQPRDRHLNQGSSLLALVNLAKRKGYELIAATDWNAFFIDKSYFSRFEIADNSIWQLYQQTDYLTHVFQLFDGTLVVNGCNRLLWHNIELDLDVVQQEIQVLPQEFRKYPGT